MPHNKGNEEDIYIPCYLFMIRYGYFVSIKNEKGDKLDDKHEDMIKQNDINKYIDYIYSLFPYRTHRQLLNKKITREVLPSILRFTREDNYKCYQFI